MRMFHVEQRARRDAEDAGWGWLALVAVAAIVIAVSACLGGCVYKGAKVVEGTDLAVGMELPGSEGTAQLNVLNYLSGFRLGVDRNASMTVKYTVAESNSWFGVIDTHVVKTVDASVTPEKTGGE